MLSNPAPNDRLDRGKRHPLEAKSVDAERLDPAIAKAINQLMLATWPQIAAAREGTVDFLLERWTHYDGAAAQRPLYHLIWEAEELLGLAHTFARTIASRDGELMIMGLANVCVAHSERGHGLGRCVVQTALERVQCGEFPLALFQTTAQVAPFYTRLGAVAVSNRFYNSLGETPTANPFWDPIAMRYPATNEWPDSDIDLRGPGY